MNGKNQGITENSRSMAARAFTVAWPAVLESFSISVAGMIDTMMVATMGSYAVAAVGLTQQPKFLGMSPFFAMNVAVSAIVARRKGEERRDDANRTLLAAMCIVVVLCFLISAVCVAFAPQIIRIAGSNPDTHDAAVIYFRIIMGGLFFAMTSFIINSAQRGSGNTRIAMITNIASSVTNILFNYLLIGGHLGFPKLGIIGAALATVLGTVVACAMSILSLFRKSSYVSIPFSVRERIRVAKDNFLRIRALAVNVLAENLLMRVGYVATAMIAARLGTDEFAAHNVGMNVLNLTYSFADGMQAAAVALTGQALGARLKAEAKRYGLICQRMGLCISFCTMLALLFGGRSYFRFCFSDPRIVELGMVTIRFSMIVVHLQMSSVVFASCLRAAGDVKYCMKASMTSIMVVRTLTTLLLTSVFGMGLMGIWIGILVDQVTRVVLMGSRFFQGKWTELVV